MLENIISHTLDVENELRTVGHCLYQKWKLCPIISNTFGVPSKSIGTVKTKCSVVCGVRTFTNMIKRLKWDKITECHILLLGDSTKMFYQLKSAALLEFHPAIWCEHKYWNSCLAGLSKWWAVSCCINSSGIKSRECVVSVIFFTSVFWILHSLITHTTQDEDERADFERKVSNLDAKEKRKSIRALAKTKGMEKSKEFRNHQQPTTT